MLTDSFEVASPIQTPTCEAEHSPRLCGNVVALKAGEFDPRETAELWCKLRVTRVACPHCVRLAEFDPFAVVVPATLSEQSLADEGLSYHVTCNRCGEEFDLTWQPGDVNEAIRDYLVSGGESTWPKREANEVAEG